MVILFTEKFLWNIWDHAQITAQRKSLIRLLGWSRTHTGSVCYLNVYRQDIASCPILPNCLSNMPTLSPRKFPLYCALVTLISSLVSANKMKETVDPTVFFQKFTVTHPNFLFESGSSQRKLCQCNLFQICIGVN
jgi:hypothetical protein